MKCAGCGMDYVESHAPDLRHHRSFHRQVSLKWPPTRSEPVTMRDGDFRIIAVETLAPMWLRKRVQGIAWRANREMRYDAGIYFPESTHVMGTHAFVAVQGNEVAGLLVIEERSHIARVTWEQFSASEEITADQTEAEQWTIGFAWVRDSFRRRGVATRLVNSAAKYLEMAPKDFAWFIPFTEAGEALARRVSAGSLLIGWGDRLQTQRIAAALAMADSALAERRGEP